MSAANHRHSYEEIDKTIFAASYAQPGVRVCRVCGMPKRGSDAEETLAEMLRWEKMPEPVREFVFAAPRKWRFDFCWPERLLAVEVEGGSWIAGAHTRGRHFEEDMAKYNAAALIGWRVLRCTPAMVSDGRCTAAIKEGLR